MILRRMVTGFFLIQVLSTGLLPAVVAQPVGDRTSTGVVSTQGRLAV